MNFIVKIKNYIKHWKDASQSTRAMLFLLFVVKEQNIFRLQIW